MKVEIAFYKAKGTWFSKLIRLWTGSPYSHAELVMDGMWYSSSIRDGGVRQKDIKAKNGHWDFITLEISPEKQKNIQEFFNATESAAYDWRGIFLSHVVPLSRHSKDKWFCSEWVAESLKKSNTLESDIKAEAISPGALYELLKSIS